MKIQCQCKKFEASVSQVKGNTIGRVACYCDDCQRYLQRLERTDLLDAYGGTEVVPFYPCAITVTKGHEYLRCNLLYRKGTHRWSASCCNSPIANTRAGFPWAGVIHSALTVEDPEALKKLGEIRSRVQGKFATNNPPFAISRKFSFKDIRIVLPFLIKGFLFKKHRSPVFYQADGKTPVSTPVMLTQNASA